MRTTFSRVVKSPAGPLIIDAAAARDVCVVIESCRDFGGCRRHDLVGNVDLSDAVIKLALAMLPGIEIFQPRAALAYFHLLHAYP
jgi:hypothetical protein